MSLYAVLMLLSFSGPFALSFDKKVAYYKDFSKVFLAALLVSIPFIIWDVFFTIWGIWGFNDNYLMGIRFFELPVEEIAFFYVIPFCCIFIHQVLSAYFNVKLTNSFTYVLGAILFLLALGMVFKNTDKTYTLWTCGLFLVLMIYGLLFKLELLSSFMITFLVCLVPFVVVNGILTGFSTPDPIVWYNPTGIIGLRITTIPVEDFFYNYNLLFSNVLIFEFLKRPFKIGFSNR